MLSKRAPSFGYGHKMQIVKYYITLFSNSISPSPEKYNLQSEFTKNPKRGASIGLSRENCSSVSIFPKSKNPGPG